MATPAHATALGRHHYVTTRRELGTPLTSYRIHRRSDDEIIGRQLTPPVVDDIAGHVERHTQEGVGVRLKQNRLNGSIKPQRAGGQHVD